MNSTPFVSRLNYEEEWKAKYLSRDYALVTYFGIPLKLKKIHWLKFGTPIGNTDSTYFMCHRYRFDFSKLRNPSFQNPPDSTPFINICPENESESSYPPLEESEWIVNETDLEGDNGRDGGILYTYWADDGKYGPPPVPHKGHTTNVTYVWFDKKDFIVFSFFKFLDKLDPTRSAKGSISQDFQIDDLNIIDARFSLEYRIRDGGIVPQATGGGSEDSGSNTTCNYSITGVFTHPGGEIIFTIRNYTPPKNLSRYCPAPSGPAQIDFCENATWVSKDIKEYITTTDFDYQFKVYVNISAGSPDKKYACNVDLDEIYLLLIMDDSCDLYK
jgi:hypothetical protein